MKSNLIRQKTLTVLVIVFILFSSSAMKNTVGQGNADTLLVGEYTEKFPRPDTCGVIDESQNEIQAKTSIRSYAVSYWTDTKAIFINPFHWKTGQIIAASAVTAGTFALIVWGDKPIGQFFYLNQSTFINSSSTYFFSPLGSGIISVPVLGIFFTYGMIWHDEKAKETGLKGIKAFVLTALLTNVLKQVTHRHRPYQDNPPDPHAWEGPFYWGGNDGTFGYNSFPSGHSSSIFSVATVIALEYWQTKWVPAVCFGLASITAIYRLAVNYHWASDVLIGSALGFAIGSMVYFNTNKKVQIIPVCSTGLGATLIYKF